MDWIWDLWRSNAVLTVGIILFVAGLGVPSPASLAIIATGSLVRHGGAGLLSTILIATFASVLGSFGSYAIAQRGLERWLEKKRRKPAWGKAVARFEKNAWGSIFFSRWLLTPLGLPVSYLAGSARYSKGGFFSACTLGSVLWVLIYGGVGYAFADSWEIAARRARGYEIWIGAAVVAIIAAVLLVKRVRFVQAA